MSESPSPPQTPDPAATAAAQTASNLATARTSSVLSNPNVITPYGKQTVTWGSPAGTVSPVGAGTASPADPVAQAWRQSQLQKMPGGFMDTGPDGAQFLNTTGEDPGGGGGPSGGSTGLPFGSLPNDQATVTQTLSPNQQALLDAQEGLSLQMAGIGQKGLNAIGDTLSTPIDSSSGQAASDKAYQAMAARLDPQWQQAQQAQELQLRNQGVVPGGEAYDNAMRVFNQGKNDAYQQANLGAMGYAPQQQQMDIAGRDSLLNELNAIRTGSQVSTPQFQQYNPTSVAPTNTMGAQQMYQQGLMNTYNQQTGSNNSMMSGLMGIAGTAAGAYFGGPAGAAAGGAAGRGIGGWVSG